ncbi:ABC transporter ATP-binding protein [Amycolatopsis ultiminotia]|uniref:ABC transporter ATP-binding protein n=1 Tax=Amycolatopsis ultiminotia TaxID=543629 RepID=A0ABP6XDF4_9PSEU
MSDTVIRSIRQFARPVFAAHRRAVAGLAAWSLLEMVPALVSGRLVAAALDRGFLAGAPGTGVLLLLAYGVAMLAGTLAVRQAMPHTAVLVESLRDALVRMVVGASLRRAVYGDEVADAATVSRITRQAETVRQTTAGLLMTVRGVVFGVIAAVAGLFSLDPLLALVAAPAVLAAAALLILLSRLLRRRYRRLLQTQEALAEEAAACLSGVRDVVTCGAWRTAGAGLRRRVDDEAEATVSSARAGTGRIGVIALGGRLPFVVILLASPWLVSRQILTPGTLVGALTYLLNGLDPALRALVQTIGNRGLELTVTLHRLIDHAAAAVSLPSGRKRPGGAEIALRGLTFAYGEHAKPVFSGLDLRIADGEHLAVVGPSGIGKSTLALLIGGVVPPRSGTVTLGGVPVGELDEPALRSMVALVPQESYVFAGALRENLAYLRPSVTDAELDEAVAAMGLSDTVRRAGGYDAETPAALSQGERQLITLARVYLSEARIVLLDEATCHLDPVSEARVEEAFAARPGTLIVVAHRISSAMRARRILLVEESGLAEGTHDVLVHRSPGYAELVGHWAPAARVP